MRALPHDRATVQIGIVHFGPGAFHRAHQAVYTDDILSLDPTWAICGVSLQNPQVRDALAQQDNIYTLAILDEKPRYRRIGAIKELLVAPENPAAVLARLATPAVRVVTSTITEKGYHLAPGGHLNFSDPDIRHDLSHPDAPRTFMGFLVEGLRQRRAVGIAPFVPVCCDNLSSNGQTLKRAALAFAQARDAALAEWIELHVPFPSTMVDSITPATDDALRARVKQDVGIADRWPVMREPFTQWVIEDAFGTYPVPPWDKAGAIFARDVHPYETAKLRLLNGCHSALAYLGMLADERNVAGAMAVPRLRDYLEHMMQDEICPGLAPMDGIHLETYCQTILARFASPHIEYLLAQIAWDGSQKIPIRLLGTLRDNLATGRPVSRLSLAVAAWMKFSIRAAHARLALRDPLKDRILRIAEITTGDAAHDVEAFLGLKEIFSDDFQATPGVKAHLITAYERLNDRNRQTVLDSLT